MHRGLKCLLVGVLAFVGLHATEVSAAVKPHGLFGDGMVLQQGAVVPVWGTADDGETVAVQFQDQKASATAKDGKWMIHFDNLKAGGPFEMTIVGKDTVHFKNVLVGEVWVCSGQSNMWWPVKLSADPERVARESGDPLLRLFTVPQKVAFEPIHEVSGTWHECGPASVKDFSAVAYFFGRDLRKALNVPVGLIHSSWGGTLAEAWTSGDGLEKLNEFKGVEHTLAQARLEFQPALEKYKTESEAYKKAVDQARKDGKVAPKPPRSPSDPAHNPNNPSVLYNGMIAPLIPYAIQGAIWYQGESNAGRARQYQMLFPTLIGDWRKHWGAGDFPFLFVQLAPWQPNPNTPPPGQWAELREAQQLTYQCLPKTGMAVITDLGDKADIHPKQKQPVGARLALAALGIAYGQKVSYAGPVFDRMNVEKDKAVLSFTHVGGGLTAKGGGKLTGFTISGGGDRFVDAEAEIRGEKVVVWSPKVDRPKAVRFGWDNFPVTNLTTKEGLPASPFRTDRLPPSPLRNVGHALRID